MFLAVWNKCVWKLVWDSHVGSYVQFNFFPLTRIPCGREAGWRIFIKFIPSVLQVQSSSYMTWILGSSHLFFKLLLSQTQTLCSYFCYIFSFVTPCFSFSTFSSICFHLWASWPHPSPSLTHYNQLGDRLRRRKVDESKEIILFWIIHPFAQSHPTSTLLLLVVYPSIRSMSLTWLSVSLRPH